MTRDDKEGSIGPTAVPSVDPGDRTPVGLRVKGRYHILSELGAGAFGTVYRAQDEATGHEVAIRFLSPVLGGGPKGAHPIERAGRSILAASAAHPALVGVLELGELDNGGAFVAMELAEGRCLSEILSTGPLEVDAALRLAIELGGALETLHNTGFVHGALRPRNVMVREDGSITLLDVELAGLRDAPVMTGLMADERPPEYLSPEQIRQAPVTEKTDIYAFATILYEMLCGEPPFRAARHGAVLAKHLTKTPIPMRGLRRGVPASVEEVVMRALAKEPEERPLMHNVLNDLWVEAHRPATRGRRTAAMVVGAALAASIAGGVGWGLFAPRRSVSPPLEQPAPPPVARQAPVSGPPVAIAPAPRTLPAPTLEMARPATVPPSTASATPPPTVTPPQAAISTPAAPPPSVAPPPSAVSPPASRPPRAERPKPPREPQTPPAPAGERPAAASNADDPDPGLVVDWLLERAAGRRQ
jgi:serine/threonine protein kinase